MPEINPLSNEQIFLKKIAENTGSDYETGDVSEINPITIDQIFLKEITANTAGQSGDITELEGKVADNTSAIDAIVNEYSSKNLAPANAFSQSINDIDFIKNSDNSITAVGTNSGSLIIFDLSGGFYLQPGEYIISDGGYSISFPGSTFIQIVDYQTGVYITTTNFGESKFTINARQKVRLELVVASGITLDGTFYPMIRDARITDSTYVPYAMTNRELTERIYVTPYVEVQANSTTHIDYPDGFTRLGTRVINIDVENTYQDQVNFEAEKDNTGIIIYNNSSNTKNVSLVLLKV